MQAQAEQKKDKKRKAREVRERASQSKQPNPKQLFPNLIRGPPVYSDPRLVGGGLYNQNPPLSQVPRTILLLTMNFR